MPKARNLLWLYLPGLWYKTVVAEPRGPPVTDDPQFTALGMMNIRGGGGGGEPPGGKNNRQDVVAESQEDNSDLKQLIRSKLTDVLELLLKVSNCEYCRSLLLPKTTIKNVGALVEEVTLSTSVLVKCDNAGEHWLTKTKHVVNYFASLQNISGHCQVTHCLPSSALFSNSLATLRMLLVMGETHWWSRSCCSHFRAWPSSQSRPPLTSLRAATSKYQVCGCAVILFSKGSQQH